MSLLMDALKKAEQEKKEAAKKRDILNDSGIHLQQDVSEKTDPNEAQEPEPIEPAPSVVNEEAGRGKSPLDLSLEPFEGVQHQLNDEDPDFEEYAPRLENEDVSPEAEQSKNVTQVIEQATVSNSDEMDFDKTDEFEQPQLAATEEPQLDMDQTFHGVELDQTFSSELMEKTVQGEPFKAEDFQKSYDETLPGVPAAQLAHDIGTGDQPTPVAAQTIFTATNSIAKPSSGFRWLLISLALLAVGSSLVFYYFSVTPVQRDIPSPLVARGVETIINTPLNNVVPPTAGIETPVSSVENQAGQLITEPAVEESVVGETAIVSTATDGSINDGLETQPEADPAPPQINVPVDDRNMSLTSEVRLPEVIEPPGALIKISRRQQATAENQLVQEAFSAFKMANYTLAETRYREALEQSPNNRDVLLGLAAIASRKGDDSEALGIYIRLLRQNPLDTIARTAVLGYQYGNNITESISILKSMLFDAPDQPLLHFTLGKLYAVRTNWSEAQKAFFDAYRLDSSNPDYALNLAISLDRLGQKQTALDYYNVAIALAGSNPAGFDSAQVQERINTLDVGN